MVNLFERIAEPIRITQTKSEYHIVPDQHRQLGTEVYSVDRVASANYLEEPQDLRAVLFLPPWHCGRRATSTSGIRTGGPLSARTTTAPTSTSRWSIWISIRPSPRSRC